MSQFLSRLIKIFIGVLILIGCLVALLPTIMSTEWGRKETVRWINKSIPGNIEIKNLNLHWTKGQSVKGLILKDPEGQVVLELEEFTTEGTLWQILRKSTSLGQTIIRDLNAAIVMDQNGETNLLRSLGIQSKPVNGISPSIIKLSQVNIESILFSPHKPLSAKITGFTQQNNIDGLFDINISLNGLWASNWKHLKTEAKKYLTGENSQEAHIQSRIENFPVDLIDQLAAIQNPALNGLFRTLLGDKLNLNIDKEPSQDGISFNMTFLSPLMRGDLKGEIKNNSFSLKEPAVFHFELNPNQINSWTRNQFSFVKPTKVEFTLTELLIPLDLLREDQTFDPCQIGLHAEVKLPETELNITNIGNIEVKSLQAHLIGQVCDKLIQIEVLGKAIKDGEPFDLHFTSSMNKPSSFNQIENQIKRSLHSTMTMSNFPLKLIPFFQTHPEWNEKIGSSINAQLDIHSEKSDWIGVLSFQTSNLILKEAKLSLGKAVRLLAPAEFSCSLNEDCLQALFKNNRISIEGNSPLSLILRQLYLPLDNPTLTQFQLDSSLSYLKIGQLIPNRLTQFDDVILKLEGQNLNQLKSILTGHFSLFDASGSPSPLTPFPLAFTQKGDWKLNQGEIEKLTTQTQIINPLSKLQVDAQINSNLVLEILQPIQMEYSLTPLSLKELKQIFQRNFPELQEPALVKMTIEPTKIDFKTFSLSQLYLQGLMRINKIAFLDTSGKTPILEDIIIPWVIDSPRNNIYTNLKGAAINPIDGKSNPISAHLQFWLAPGQMDISHFPTEVRLNLTGVPTNLVNLAVNIPNLNQIIGPIIDLNINSFYDLTSKNPGYCDIIFDSSNFHFAGNFHLNQKVTLFNKNKFPNFKLTITPQSYELLKDILNFKSESTLLEPFSIHGKLLKLDIPFQKTLKNFGTFDLNFASSEIQWKNSSLHPLKIEGNVSSNELNQLDLGVKALEIVSIGKNKTPSDLFEGRVSLMGKVENGTLVLTKPLESSFKMSSNFSQTFISPNIPWLSSIIQTENPMTLTIDPEGFSLPISSFELEKVRIGKGSIDLGKVLLKNEGEWTTILNFIRPSADRQLAIWFTPIYFGLDKGILTFQRFDMLVNNAYTLANWGILNLSNSQGDFVLGLSAQTLEAVFGVRGLDKNYLFQIPLHISKGKIELDKKKATAKISALLAQMKGGTTGKLIGNLLDIALSDKGELHPQPTTVPFPWHKEFNPQSSKPQHSKNEIREDESHTNQPASNPKEENANNGKRGKKKKKEKNIFNSENLKNLSEEAIQFFDHLLKE